jgi:high-affinity K+ transport system ATPase subunit B
MGYPRTSNISETEVQIQAALLAYKNKQFFSICVVACYFKVPYATLHCCIAGGQSQAQANKTRQILSNTEEKILV